MPLPSFAPLTSRRLIIRPLREADIADLLEINGDPEVTQFLPYAAWQSLADGQAWFERMSTMVQASTAHQLVLELTARRQVIGTLLYFHHDDKSARGEIGYVLGRRHWGQGLMAEALQVFCSHVFCVAGVRRLEAEVNPANHASAALLQRLGFTHEGSMRQRWVAKGAPYDTRLYGLLADEWLARKPPTVTTVVDAHDSALTAAGGQAAASPPASAPGSPAGPRELRVRPADSTELTIRPATRDDIDAIVALLADDPLGAQREAATSPLPMSYRHAFEAIAADANNELVVGQSARRVVGVLQLTFLPSITYRGGWRAQIEGVRVSADLRSSGVGRALFDWAIARARERGCHLVQLTSDKKRPDAIRFYEALGFVASHEGLKLKL